MSASVVSHLHPSSPWELAAENIAVKIRWFGILVGYFLVYLGSRTAREPSILNAILALGVVYTLFDTWNSMRGKVLLGAYPLVISLMEAIFIGLLCSFDCGLESSFRYYYFLSLICCAIRRPSALTYASCALHSLSWSVLYLTLPLEKRDTVSFALTLVMLGWVTWASNALASLLKQVGEYLSQLNRALQQNQAHLEDRIAERTRQLQEAQARVLHQEKMAAFGLLAAGIAHEVGNPLASISALIQLLQRRVEDGYTQDRLSLINGQLQRIRGTLRELIEFSRPATNVRTRVALGDILEEALNIAKYYKRTRGRILPPTLPPNLPPLSGVRDQLVQIFVNLVLNAIDAVSEGKGERVQLTVVCIDGAVEVSVMDDGCGIPEENKARLFQPYFTTKKHGTGLGLFVTRQLVTEHGGNITCHSECGRGTTFQVRLPFAGPVVCLSEKLLPGPKTDSLPEAVAW